MAVITYLGTEYTVDHAVKGADFIHGYDADSIMIVSFEGISDFSGFSYDGTYMEPEHCLAEGCNDVKYVDGGLKKADGTELVPADYGAQPAGSYAASSHTHAASDIASGTLGVARGGTGVTSNPSMLTNLASTTAASVFAASPRPGVTGTLPVANGGTGQTTLTPAVTTKALRSIYAGTSDMTAGTTALTTGQIYLVYE